jgi:hypothetical protein
MSGTLQQRTSRPRSHAERLASRDGYFPPESVIRRVGNSPVTPSSAAAPRCCWRSPTRWLRSGSPSTPTKDHLLGKILVVAAQPLEEDPIPEIYRTVGRRFVDPLLLVRAVCPGEGITSTSPR